MSKILNSHIPVDELIVFEEIFDLCRIMKSRRITPNSLKWMSTTIEYYKVGEEFEQGKPLKNNCWRAIPKEGEERWFATAYHAALGIMCMCEGLHITGPVHEPIRNSY